jgi:hypothetical protein
MFSHEHRRPLYAFGVVALVAALVAGNGLRAQAVSVLVAAQAPEPLIGAIAPDMVLGEHLTRVVSGEAAAEPSDRPSAEPRRSTAPQAAPTTAPVAATTAPERTARPEADRPQKARKKPGKHRSKHVRVSPPVAARSGAVAATPARPGARLGQLDTHPGRGLAKGLVDHVRGQGRGRGLGHLLDSREGTKAQGHEKGHVERLARHGKGHARGHGKRLGRGHSAHRGR